MDVRVSNFLWIYGNWIGIIRVKHFLRKQSIDVKKLLNYWASILTVTLKTRWKKCVKVCNFARHFLFVIFSTCKNEVWRNVSSVLSPNAESDSKINKLHLATNDKICYFEIINNTFRDFLILKPLRILTISSRYPGLKGWNWRTSTHAWSIWY